MKTEDKKLLKSKSVSLLTKELVKTREKLANFKKEYALGKLKSSRTITRERRKIAYLLTIIREKMLKKAIFDSKELDENEKK